MIVGSALVSLAIAVVVWFAVYTSSGVAMADMAAGGAFCVVFLIVAGLVRQIAEEL
jgi:hypothetical protein